MNLVDITVHLIDKMGTDLSVVNAARVSFDKTSDVFDVDKDVKLINYLAAHNHWSPFAHTTIQFKVKAPIFVARQMVKHQVGGVWNEVSRRYVSDNIEFYTPETWRGAPVNAKQGSTGLMENQSRYAQLTERVISEALLVYQMMIDEGVAPEQARMILPTNLMTEWYWTGSLVFWQRVCKLRLDPHAQKECADVAQLINKECSKLFPVSWNALMR